MSDRQEVALVTGASRGIGPIIARRLSRAGYKVIVTGRSNPEIQALAAERSNRPVLWLHGARDRQHYPFATEARALISALPLGRRHVCFRPPALPGHAAARPASPCGRRAAPAEGESITAIGDVTEPPGQFAHPGSHIAEKYGRLDPKSLQHIINARIGIASPGGNHIRSPQELLEPGIAQG